MKNWYISKEIIQKVEEITRLNKELEVQWGIKNIESKKCENLKKELFQELERREKDDVFYNWEETALKYIRRKQ
jgi:flagellar motility protein MotE (MotC chaperone)